MTMRRVSHPDVSEPPPETWSNCRVMGDRVYIAGMTARGREGGVAGEGDVYAQSRDIFEKIQKLIETAGGKMNDVIKVNIYVTDITRREEVWKARREFFTGDFPASTLVEVSALALPEMLVEIEAVGFIGAGSD
jgi:enamine deaminase RidA (YjgF/YER057c/UK114 family)